MLHKRNLWLIVALLALIIAVVGLLLRPTTAQAGSGSIPEFEVRASGTNINIHIKVDCPNHMGFSWRVGLDGFGRIVGSGSSQSSDFTVDGSSIPNGHHNFFAAVRCEGEPTDWNGASTSNKDLDWFGGNPTPVPPPPGHEVAVTLSVSPTTVPPGTKVNITAQASCTNTNVRAIRITFSDGAPEQQLGGPVLTTSWSSNIPGTYWIKAEAACSGDDQWKTSPNATVNVTVQPGAQPSGGQGSSGTAGNQTDRTNPGNLADPPTITPAPAKRQTAAHGRFKDAAQSNPVGGVDIDPVCQWNKFAGARNFGGTAKDWYCIRADGSKVPVEWDSVCRDVYGSEYHADYLGNGAGDIRCVTDDSNPPVVNPPVIAPNCSPLPSQVKVGDIAINSSAVDLHAKRDPKTSADSLFVVPQGTHFSIVSGPQCGESRTWWQIGMNGQTGWLAEANSQVYNFSPGQPSGNQNPGGGNKPSVPATGNGDCSKAISVNVSVGQQALVAHTDGTPNRLRRTPSKSGQQITSIAEGQSFSVIGGPVCADGYRWWNVSTSQGDGWMADSSDGIAYIEPVAAPSAQSTPPPFGAVIDNNQPPAVGDPVPPANSGNIPVAEGSATLPIQGAYVKVNSFPTTFMRACAEVGCVVIAKLVPNQFYAITGDKVDWIRVKTAHLGEGWVQSAYVTRGAGHPQTFTQTWYADGSSWSLDSDGHRVVSVTGPAKYSLTINYEENGGRYTVKELTLDYVPLPLVAGACFIQAEVEVFNSEGQSVFRKAGDDKFPVGRDFAGYTMREALGINIGNNGKVTATVRWSCLDGGTLVDIMRAVKEQSADAGSMGWNFDSQTVNVPTQ